VVAPIQLCYIQLNLPTYLSRDFPAIPSPTKRAGTGAPPLQTTDFGRFIVFGEGIVPEKPGFSGYAKNEVVDISPQAHVNYPIAQKF
jgi:hypothetical protein